MDTKFSNNVLKPSVVVNNKDNQNTEPKTNQNTTEENTGKINTIKTEDDLEEEYLDKRTITINPVRNYSLYRKVNDKALPRRNDFIGSSVKSSRVLASNKGEIETYFPNLIGLAPNNPEFITRVKQYLNNIQISVNELGRTFDISFRYNHKKDYLKIKEQEDAIERRFQAEDRSNIEALKKALNNKINSINELESTKYKYGYPVSIEDYLMYRHCLLYSDIAKDMSLINSSPNIRFYFKDDVKEEIKLKKHRAEVLKAKSNYVACVGDPELFEAVYIQYCSHVGIPTNSVLTTTQVDKELNLDKFSTEQPAFFNSICMNKDVKLVAKIEKLIIRGELVRYRDNQNITTTDGTLIGSNIKEAVSWFKNPNNAALVEIYFNKLNKY